MTSREKNQNEIYIYKASVITFILVFLTLSAYLALKNISTLNQSMISSVLIFSTATSSLFVSLATFNKKFNEQEIQFKKYKFLFFTLATSIAISFISAIAGHLSGLLLPLAFKNIPYTALGMSLVAAGLSSFLVYFVADFILGLNQKKFSLLILVTFLSGFFVSAVNSQDYSWWQWSICSLGMPINKTELYYNFTMILTGILVLGLGLYLRPQLDAVTKKGLLSQKESKILVLLFYIAAIVVSLVGVFPYGISRSLDFIHVFFGYYAFAHIGLIILFSKWLFGKFPKNFFILSYLIWIITVLYYFSNLYFLVFPAAIAEIIVMIIAVIWIIFLIRTFETLSETTPVAQ